MATFDPASLLKNIAQGSFREVVEQNNKLILIKVDTVKVKNKVLREFAQKALNDGYTHEEVLELILSIDGAIETNEVKKVLNDFIN